MALTSTLGSPGIEIREIDNSIRIDSSTATTVFVPGFASQGPVEEVMSIGSMDDFELIYGKPTNGAERYFYYTVKALIDKGGSGCRVLTSRLPYGEGLGDAVSDAYTLLAYPAVPVIKKQHNHAGKTFTLDSDCFKINSEAIKSNYFKIKSTTDTTLTGIEITEEFSSFDFFIEEDFLKDIDFDFTKEISFGITSKITDEKGNESTLKLPKISSSSDVVAPTLSWILPQNTSGETDTGVTSSDGKISTEFIGGYLYVNLSYSLFHKKETDTDKTKVGDILIRLAYKATTDNKLTSTNVDEYALEDFTNSNLKFFEAFEIAKSYDGQSEEQLGNWSITEEYDEEEHEDTEDKTLTENTDKFSKDVTYLVGAPVTFQVSLKEYYDIITGEYINWSRRPYDFTDSDEEVRVYETSNDKVGSESRFGLLEALGHSAFITINTSRTCINENFEGYYLGITDNTFTTPSDDYIFDAIKGVKITTSSYVTKNADADDGDLKKGILDAADEISGDYSTLGEQRLTFKLASNNQGSLSQVITRSVTSKDISGTDFDDTISMALFKLSKTTDSNDVLKLSYSLREKYNWSFSKNRLKSSTDSTKPVSYYAPNVMESSNNITILINPYIANKDFSSFDGTFHGKMRVYGDKLINNLDKFEDKYLRRTYTHSSQTAKKNYSAYKVAKNNINSYKDLIKQAGISPYIIRTKLQDTANTYKTFAPVNSIYPFGVYTTSLTSRKVIGQVPSKLSRALALVENDEQYPDIDLLVEGGLGTIFMNSNGHEMSGEYASRSLVTNEATGKPISTEDDKKVELEFDENVILIGVEDMRTSRSSLSDDATDVITDYLAVTNVFTQFANAMQNGGRGDTFFISDIPRGILIKGKDTKITNLYGVEIENNAYEFGESVVHSFPTSVYYPIKHQFDSIVSTYMSTYAQWLKIYDDFTGDKVWIPVSGHIAANMASTDAVYGPWYASAGLRRGVINGVLDYAISPTITQRTDLYKICINSVPKIPNYGVTIWGIRTMGKKDSAFDQNTCRRTFLYMEKKVKQLLRYYLFEPNTSFTRLQIFNDIDPFLEGIKNRGGIYSYTLVTDTTVNTPEIINNGDLVVAIAAAPTRTAENIIVEFTANKYTEEVSASETLG